MLLGIHLGFWTLQLGLHDSPKFPSTLLTGTKTRQDLPVDSIVVPFFWLSQWNVKDLVR